MANCNDYISADDLKTGKQAILHIEHVAKSRDATGKPALEATDTIRGESVTNKTLDGFFSSVGFKPADGSFEGGSTINHRWETLLYESEGNYYQWMGMLPKIVPPGSTPATTGGIDATHWVNQTDLMLRSDLNKSNGLSYIGTVSSVSELSSISGSIGDSIILDSYVSGFNFGGGIMVAVSATTTVDNIVTFPGNGVVWKRKFFNGTVDVYDAGYTGTEDLAVFINKINAAGFDCVVPVSGEITTPIIFDIAKGALIGKNKCTLTETASVTGDYYLTIINTGADYINRDAVNATALMSGVSFVGKGSRKLAIGGSTSGVVSELRISNSGFISTAGIEFLDNAYRILFDKCALSRSFTNSAIFNSPANSGEVIKFNHCWMVDNGGPFTFVNGQFIFDSCSLPAGKKSGYFDPTVALSDNATVVFTNGNIEYQPGQSFVGFTVDGSSRLTVSNSTILLPDGYTSVPIVSNGDGVVSLNNCSLPLYGNTTIATGFPTRQLIGGASKKVMSRGCYPRAGFITSNWNLGSIVSPYINSISNGSGQFLNISNWTLSQTGTGVVTATTTNDVPNDLMFSTSFVLSVPSSDAAANFTQTIIDCEPGRYFQLGFWAKNTTTTLASLRFLDQQGNAVADSMGYNISAGGTFNFYALVDCVPPGAYKAEINFNVSSVVGGVVIHNAIYGLI
ncbi:tail fibers protein [Escherichia phage vB_EcoS_PJ16]|nr:tail fibers protein [Escherichia phage vB_EcoS_PJ16]